MRIVVTGATGLLGTYLVDRLLEEGTHEVVPWGRRAGAIGTAEPRSMMVVELTDRPQVEEALDRIDPDAIIHAAAISSAEGVRREPERGWLVNVGATQTLAGWCGRRGRRLVFTSTDMVFDGEQGWYDEDDPPAPIVAYGRTKAEAEAIVRRIDGGLVARLSLLYGPSRNGRASFYDQSVSALRAGKAQVFFEDEFRSPLHYATAAQILTRLADSDATGLVHVGGKERLSRYQLMLRAAGALGLETRLISANRRADAVFPEPRPADCSLKTGRLESLLPGLDRPEVEEAVHGAQA